MEIADESVPLLIIEARRFYHRHWKTVNRVSNVFVTTGSVIDWRGIEFGPESGHIDVIVQGIVSKEGANQWLKDREKK